MPSDPPGRLLRSITFIVPGLPAPQGSKKAFAIRKGGVYTGKTAVAENSRHVGPWRDRVALAAHHAWLGEPLLIDVPVFARIEFILKRATGTPKTRPTPPAIKANGDLDKLERAVYDAITGVIIQDDKLIIRNENSKRIAEIGESTGAIITVEELQWPTTTR